MIFSGKSRLVGAALLLCAAASGQTAQITGLITNSNGAAVPAASVVVRNIDTDIKTETVTNNQGLLHTAQPESGDLRSFGVEHWIPDDNAAGQPFAGNVIPAERLRELIQK
jgi:hypothetical protein